MNLKQRLSPKYEKLAYTIAARGVFAVHQVMIGMNTLAIPAVIYYEPWYIWMPIITMLVSPVLGGTWCIFNQLEDYYRDRAGLTKKDRG